MSAAVDNDVNMADADVSKRMEEHRVFLQEERDLSTTMILVSGTLSNTS